MQLTQDQKIAVLDAVIEELERTPSELVYLLNSDWFIPETEEEDVDCKFLAFDHEPIKGVYH